MKNIRRFLNLIARTSNRNMKAAVNHFMNNKDDTNSSIASSYISRFIKKVTGIKGITRLIIVFLFVFNSITASGQLCGTKLIGATQPVGYQNLTQA